MKSIHCDYYFMTEISVTHLGTLFQTLIIITISSHPYQLLFVIFLVMHVNGI